MAAGCLVPRLVHGYPGNEAKSSLESSFHKTVKTCMAEGSGQSVKSLTPPTLQALAYELASVKDWYSLGLNLGLKVHQLHVIECNYRPNSTRCKTEMLDVWLHDTRYPSWEAVIDALCRMGKFTVALGIKRKYCSSTTTVETPDAASQPSQPTPCSHGRTTTDMKPTLAQLTMLKNAKGEKVEIIKTIAPDWMDVGSLMDLDPKGRTIGRIEADNAHKRNAPVACCRVMFTLWLDMPDSTWGNLIKLLIDSEYTDLARQVQDALGL